MEDISYNDNNNYECILQKITSLRICLITEIFAFSSNFPFRFLYLVSKSKNLQKIIKEVLSNINMENNFLSKQTLKYIDNYILAQKIYLPLLEKTIEQKILGFNFDFPGLDTIQNIESEDDYKSVVYNDLKEELYEKYNSLKIFVNHMKYTNRNNRKFLEKISESDIGYYNNCIFILDDIESIQIIINLLYNNNYLNFKNNLKIIKINEADEIKLILGDKNIKYILEYPRAIIIRNKFTKELKDSNIDFYLCSFENRNRLYSIIYERKNEENLYEKGNIINYEKNKKSMNMVINKANILLKEIDLYLKEFQSINAETLEFKNFLIESSIYDYFISGPKYNKQNMNSINKFGGSKSIDNLIKKNSDLIKINFEKDYFEMDLNGEIAILHCSELIDFINSSKHIINLYLYNFPLSYLKRITNPLIEFISIDNFFNFDKDITFCCHNINHRLPKLKKINIKYSNYDNSKEIIFIKRNRLSLKDIKLNLNNSTLIINSELNNNDLNKIYSYIQSFEGINKFNFEENTIKISDNRNNGIKIDMFLNYNNNVLMNNSIIKEVDLNILKYINYYNLLIYGHILNGIKPIKYYIMDEKSNNNNFIDDLDLVKDRNIFNLINKNINNFSETCFSLIFKKDYFFFPFIQNIILKIDIKKLQKFLFNCISCKEVYLYNINIESLYKIKNENIKKLNLFFSEEKVELNNSEFNLRFIYNNIPSLNKISINLFNASIIFGKKILPSIFFKIKYKNDNNILNLYKKILILDFGDNIEVLSKIKDRNIINIHSKNDIIFKFNDNEITISKDKKLINPFLIKNNIMKILMYLYILTIIIILFIVLKSFIF